MLICTNVDEVFDPLLLPVNPSLTLGQLEEICQPVTNVVLRDSEGAVSGEKTKKMSTVATNKKNHCSGSAFLWGVMFYHGFEFDLRVTSKVY